MISGSRSLARVSAEITSGTMPVAVGPPRSRPWAGGSSLPFKDDVFDLFIDRHTSKSPSEVMLGDRVVGDPPSPGREPKPG